MGVALAGLLNLPPATATTCIFNTPARTGWHSWRGGTTGLGTNCPASFNVPQLPSLGGGVVVVVVVKKRSIVQKRNQRVVVVQKEVPINVASSSTPVKQPYLRGGVGGIGGITVLDASQWTLRQPDGDTCGGGKECVQGKQAAADQGVGSGGIRVPQSHLQPVVGLVSVKKILSGVFGKTKSCRKNIMVWKKNIYLRQH